LAAAVTGVTPEYGLHIEENRKGSILVKVEASIKDEFDYSLLGWYIGELVGNKIPVFTGMPKELTPEAHRNLGAELNTSGAVSLYHIVGVTPEAKTLDMALGDLHTKEIAVTDDDLERTHRKISAKRGSINSVFIGCPHSTLREVRDIANLLKGRELHRDTTLWICTSSHVRELARRLGHLQEIEKAGGHVVSDTCIDEPCWKYYEGGLGMTDSPKNAYYRERRGQPFIMGKISDCI